MYSNQIWDAMFSAAIQAKLMDTMGQVYSNLGLYEQARALSEQALRLSSDLDGAGPSSSIHLAHLAEILRRQGRFEEAALTFDRALVGLRQRRRGHA